MNNIAAIPVNSLQDKTDGTAGMLQNSPTAPANLKEGPLSVFEHDNAMPYSAHYFGINGGEYNAMKQVNLDGLPEKLGEIENYVMGKVKNFEYMDSTKSLHQVMDDIKGQLGIKEFEPYGQQIDKIYAFITGGNPKLFDPEFKRTTVADKVNQKKEVKFREFKVKEPSKYQRVNRIFSKFYKQE